MDRTERKAAVAAYKERRAPRGIYAAICNATGEAWVGRSLDLDAYRNRLVFALRMGGTPYPSLQAAWRLHGEDAFRFEELERLREDFPAISLDDELKRRQAMWKTRLGALAL